MNEQVSFFQLDGGPSVVRMPAKSAPVAAKAPASAPPAPSARRGGIVGRMQAGLATALKKDPDWEEF
jgi:hypothetical protein